MITIRRSRLIKLSGEGGNCYRSEQPGRRITAVSPAPLIKLLRWFGSFYYSPLSLLGKLVFYNIRWRQDMYSLSMCVDAHTTDKNKEDENNNKE